MFLQYINLGFLVGLIVGTVTGASIFTGQASVFLMALSAMAPTTILILGLLRENSLGYLMGLGIAFVQTGVFAAGFKGLWGLLAIAIALIFNPAIRQTVISFIKEKVNTFLRPVIVKPE